MRPCVYCMNWGGLLGTGAGMEYRLVHFALFIKLFESAFANFLEHLPKLDLVARQDVFDTREALINLGELGMTKHKSRVHSMRMS